jgi:hypothetical protein
MAFRVLPRELAPTRVWRLAEALALGVRDPAFEVLLQRIAGRRPREHRRTFGRSRRP